MNNTLDITDGVASQWFQIGVRTVPCACNLSNHKAIKAQMLRAAMYYFPSMQTFSGLSQHMIKASSEYEIAL